MEIHDRRHQFTDDSTTVDQPTPDTPQARTLALVEDLRKEVAELKAQVTKLTTENNLLTSAIDLALEMESKIYVDQCTVEQKNWFLAGWHRAFQGIRRISDALNKVRGMSQLEIDTTLELRENQTLAKQLKVKP